ncbi:MAG: hypothetical protein Q7U54_06580 [Bacteroidales bacterium]|nr:hypothetical protein [Bacteroidales bacterium]
MPQISQISQTNIHCHVQISLKKPAESSINLRNLWPKYFLRKLISTIILILAIGVLNTNLFSQNIKTYTGTRSVSVLNFTIEGTETYKYLENNGDRIRTGTYSYAKDHKKSNYNSYTGRYEEGIARFSINGNYTNNKPDKTWTSKITGDLNSTEMNIITTCAYEKGKLNGKYSSRIEYQEYNKKGITFLTECTFKNNKIAGKYMLRAGTKGSTSPEYTCSIEFDKNGFLTNEYYKNGFSLLERSFPTYDTAINAIFLNDTLFVPEKKGYIDLNTGSIYDIMGIENDCFSAFTPGQGDLILIFQVTGEIPRIYVTRTWIVPEFEEVQSLISEFNEMGFTGKALKLGYYFNLSQGFKFAREGQYQNAKYSYSESLTYKDDPEVRNKIVDLQKFIEFDSLVSLANINFKTKQYNEAELLYQKALTLRSDQSVEGMMVKINMINEKYKQFILIAETEYKNDKPEASKNTFQQALTVKPNEQYPKDFIRKIDDEKYNKLVNNAEDEYKSEKFEIAKSYFELAKAVKPSENYPKEFIRKIDNENANIRSSADSLFRLKDFDNALLAFKQSLKYNSNNNKSKEKIRDIENTKNEISETNIKINKKKIELEPELGRVLKKVYLSTNAYFENKLYAEKDIFIALSIKKKFFEVLKKIQALEETKDKEIQKQLKDVETPEEYIKILGE